MLNRFLFIVLLISLVTVGCDQATEVTSVPQEETLLELAPTSQFQAVMAIQDRHTDRLLAISGAVGTATGLTEEGKPAIVVFITTNALAKSAQIPASIEEVPVIIKVTGMFVALTDPTTRQSRPVPIGVSTGHPDITAGTIGARVTDGTNVFALSNNHVYANINEATLGDNVLQPGPFDGGEDPADKIGELFDFEPILFDGSDNIIDAAIAKSSTDLLGNSTPSDDGYGTPNSTIALAFAGQEVQKYGRTTKLTTGKVVGINGTFNVCYKSRGPFMCNPNFIAKFVDQIVIEPGSFSSGGDSGSLIVDANKNPVGLLFAGSSSHTIANPIDLVLERFGVTVDGEAPPPPTTGWIGGTVTNTSGGAAIAGAAISLDTGQSTTTAGDGSYTITDVPTGGRSVTASADGFESETKTVTVNENQTTIVDFALNEAPSPNDAPTVSITSPADGSTFDSGATISFAGSASDTEDGDLTASLVWTSDIDDGLIGTGGSFSTTLSDGNHTITADVTDSDGATGSASIGITVGTPPATPTLSVSVTTNKASYVNKEQVEITVTVANGANPVEGAAVHVEITTGNERFRLVGDGNTDVEEGVATFTYKINSKRDGVGTYTVDATASKDGFVSGSGSKTFEVTK